MSPSQAKIQPARGILMNLRDGLIPIAVFTVTSIATVFVTTLVRWLLASAGYGTQRIVVLLITGVGLLAAIVLCILAIRRAWMIAKTCEEQGLVRDAQRIRWATVCGSLVLLVPVVLGFVLPQHPAVLGP